MKNSETYELAKTYDPEAERAILQKALMADHKEMVELSKAVEDVEKQIAEHKYWTHVCCRGCNPCCECGREDANVDAEEEEYLEVYADEMEIVCDDDATEPYSYPDSYYEQWIERQALSTEDLTALERASREGWITDEEIEALTAQDFINLINAEYDQAGPSLTELWDPAADGAWDGAAAA
jgi:hypothetical protein